MALTASSTKSDALAQINANLDFDTSPAKAKLVLEGVRWIKVNDPIARGSESASWRYRDLDSIADKAQEVVDSDMAAGNRASFTRGRPRY